jgi:hypothetical protein
MKISIYVLYARERFESASTFDFAYLPSSRGCQDLAFFFVLLFSFVISEVAVFTLGRTLCSQPPRD